MSNTSFKTTLARILQTDSFSDPETRITEECVDLLEPYIELFVRECVLRSFETREDNVDVKNLDYTDIERIAGLLLMDFQ